MALLAAVWLPTQAQGEVMRGRGVCVEVTTPRVRVYTVIRSVVGGSQIFLRKLGLL
jgi:hypothetical protein